MMRRLLFALLLCFPLLLGQQYNIPFNPQASSGPTVLCEMDFEGSGCADGSSGDTCTASFSADPDCDAIATSNCPLTGGGSLSGWVTGDAGPNDKIFMDTVHSCTGATKVTVDFKLFMPSGASNHGEIFSLRKTGQVDVMTFGWKPSNQKFIMYCGDANRVQSAETGGLTQGTLYNVRFNIDTATYVCDWYIDIASGGQWGSGDEATGTLNSSDTGSTIIGVIATESDADIELIVDNIGVCDATGGYVAEDTKCGD